MTPARNGLQSHAVVGSRSSEAKGELGLGRPRRMNVVHPSSDRPWPLAIALPGGGALFPARCAVGGLENEMLVVEEGQVSPAWPADRRRPVALGRGGAQL
jgi:hypothetical protein